MCIPAAAKYFDTGAGHFTQPESCKAPGESLQSIGRAGMQRCQNRAVQAEQSGGLEEMILEDCDVGKTDKQFWSGTYLLDINPL